MKPLWLVLRTGGGSTVHLMPHHDLIEHEAAADCICGTDVEPMQHDDGSLGFLVVHVGLDPALAAPESDEEPPAA